MTPAGREGDYRVVDSLTLPGPLRAMLDELDDGVRVGPARAVTGARRGTGPGGHVVQEIGAAIRA